MLGLRKWLANWLYITFFFGLESPFSGCLGLAGEDVKGICIIETAGFLCGNWAVGHIHHLGFQEVADVSGCERAELEPVL